MNNRFLFICLFWACSVLRRVSGLDATFIPSDPDGPLPLSQKYRDEMRKLCAVMKEAKKQSKSLPVT